MSKPVLVVLVSEPVELARLVHLAEPYLPVHRGKVASSRAVAGLEGIMALSWVDGCEDIEQAMDLLDVVAAMCKSLKWSYHLKIQQQRVEELTKLEQGTMF